MKRAEIYDRLADSRRQVEEGAVRIMEQRDVLDELLRAGQDTKAAEIMLRVLLSAQAHRVTLLERLRLECKRLH